MKKTLLTISGAALLGLAAITEPQGVLRAQTTEETTVRSISSAGVISEFGPKTIVIRSETSSAPIRYSYSKTTTYVDETGAPVSLEVVKSGLPVTVFYEKIGDEMVASKVVVHKTVRMEQPAEVVPAAPVIEQKKTTTTTTTEEER